MTCKHYTCRCARANELAQQGRTLEAVKIHRDDEPVRCRKVELDRKRPKIYTDDTK